MTARMTKFLTFSRQKLSDHLYSALCIFLIILVSGCGDAYYSSSETGSIAFSVEWKGAPTIQPTSRAIKAASLDCEAAGVSTVRFDLYDEDNSYLVGDFWPCSYHEGTVHGIPAGSNRKLVVSGEDSNGNVLYRGEVTGITVIAGQTANVGLIEVDPAYPDTVVDIILVGAGPHGVAITPNGSYVYVVNGFDDTVSVIRTSDNTVVDTISVGWMPDGLAITPDGSYVYVANSLDGTVSVIRTSDNTVAATISVGLMPDHVAVTPNGSYIYVVNGFDDTVSVIRTSDNTVVDTISVGEDPNGVAVSPNGSYVYVTSTTDDTVSVIETLFNTVVDTISVDAYALAVTPNGDYIYATTNEGVSVIRTSDNTVVDTISVDFGTAVAVTPNGSYIYVTNWYSDTVSVIRTSDNTVVDTIAVDDEPTDIAVTPNGSYVYVTHPGDITNPSNDKVSVIGFSGYPHAPSAPTNVSATAGDGEVTISWDNVSGAISYNIYGATSSGVSKDTYKGKIEDIYSTSYTHTGLTNGTTYYYIVTAENSYGESGESEVVSATPSAVGTNTSPTASITSPTDGSTFTGRDTITFSGTGEDAEDGSLTGDSLVWTSSTDGEIGTGTSFEKSDLSVGAHTITLTATDSVGASGSDSVGIIIEPAVPGWISHANMPTGGYWGATAVWDNMLYVIGGVDRSRAIEAYDPISDSWVIKNDYHVGYLVRAITVGNVIYVLGDEGEFWKYTPSNDTWETLPDAPTPEWVSELAEVDGKIYVFGGRHGDGRGMDSVWEYNQSSGVWTSKAPMPTGRYGSATAVIDNKIYVFGGNWGTSSNEVYDPSTDIWGIKSDLPLKLWGWDVAGPSGWRICVVEAEDPGSTVIYDPIADTYEMGDEIPTPSDYPMGDSINDSIFVAGGQAAPNKLESYQPAEVLEIGLRKPKAAPSAAMMEAYMQKHKKMDALLQAMEK